MCRCSSQVSVACSAKHSEALLSAGAAENLSLQKSCWIQQQRLALLTEAILMFYWFFYLFIFFCSSLHMHTLTPSLSRGTAKQAKNPYQALVSAPVYPHPGLPEQVAALIAGHGGVCLTSCFDERSVVLPCVAKVSKKSQRDRKRLSTALSLKSTKEQRDNDREGT